MAFVLGIIPARGGSKGIRDKNIIALGGKPLISYTIEAAKGSRSLSDFILSTDSPVIAQCAAEYGLKTSSLRPSELSKDTTRSIDVVIYEIEKYESTYNVCVDVIVLLQPTLPLRMTTDIDKALAIFFRSGADSLISVYKANFVHPSIMYYYNNGNLISTTSEGKKTKRRQEFKPVYIRNGALYIARRVQIMERKNFIGKNLAAYIMPRERSVNIDEQYDLELTEWIMNRYG